MPRRLLAASLLALLALATIAPRTFAKPPDLPDNPDITVQKCPGSHPGLPPMTFINPVRPEDGLLVIPGNHVIPCSQDHLPTQWQTWLPQAVLYNIHPLMAFVPPDHFRPHGGEEACEGPSYQPGCAVPGRGCDKHACAMVDLGATRCVLDNIRSLTKSAKLIKKAKKLAARGQLVEAAGLLAKAAEMCPGSMCAIEAERVMTAVAAAMPPAREEAVAEEDAEDVPFEGCNKETTFGFLGAAQQFGLCPLNAALEAFKTVKVGQVDGEPGPCAPIEMALRRPVSVSFDNVPLVDAVEELRRVVDLPVDIDHDALTKCGVNLRHPVTMHLQSAPVGHVLDVMVRPLGLEPVVTGPVVRLTAYRVADSCRIGMKCETTCEPCPKAEALHARNCLGTKVQVEALIKACYLAVEAKRYAKAAELARAAHALDADRVEGDPLVYKMHLLSDACQKSDEPAVEPPTDCPASGAETPNLSAITPAGEVTVIGSDVSRSNVVTRQVPTFAGTITFTEVEVAEENAFGDVLIRVQETATGGLMFGVGVNADAGLTGGIEAKGCSFEMRCFPGAVKAYHDDRAFRGAGPERCVTRRAPSVLQVIGAAVLDKVFLPTGAGDAPNGIFTLGLSLTGRVTFNLSHRCGEMDVNVSTLEGLPVVYVTPRKAQ